MARPIVLIISNGLGGWPQFKEDLGEQINQIDLRSCGLYNFNEAFAQAVADGGPTVICIGCIVNGVKRQSDNVWTSIIRSIRNARKDGQPAYEGKIIGLCDQDSCIDAHLEAGCDEVHPFYVGFGSPQQTAAKRIIEILKGQGSLIT